VTAVRASADRHGVHVDVQMRDTGVAPFSYDWPLQLAAVDHSGRIVAVWTTAWSLRSVTPLAAQQFSTDLPTRDLHGRYTLLLRAANPLPGGVPLRFANATQDSTRSGWLTLADTRLG
jgi:hypothetical protein